MIKRILTGILLAIILIVPLTGCADMTAEQALSMLSSWLQEYYDNMEESGDEETGEDIGLSLSLTYPAGASPKVFTSGWVFGARAEFEGKDYSNQVQWSGSGSFSPDTGSRSRPVFDREGGNTIKLSVTIDKKIYTKTFSVDAVSPHSYAHVGTNAEGSVALGCPACPHIAKGPITSGSPNIFINGKPAARVGDTGIVLGSCGSGKFTIVSGDSSVLINGKPAASIGSQVEIHRGMGKIVSN